MGSLGDRKLQLHVGSKVYKVSPQTRTKDGLKQTSKDKLWQLHLPGVLGSISVGVIRGASTKIICQCLTLL